MVLDYAIRNYKVERLYKLIDEALDRGDQKEFIKLSTKLREVTELGS